MNVTVFPRLLFAARVINVALAGFGRGPQVRERKEVEVVFPK